MENFCVGINEYHCFHPFYAKAFSSYLYVLLSLFAFSVSVSRSQRLKEYGQDSYLRPGRIVSKYFPYLISFSFLLRAGYFILKMIHALEVYDVHVKGYRHVMLKMWILPNGIIDLYPVGVSLSGKVATLLYFSAFTLLVRFWDQILCQHRHMADRKRQIQGWNNSMDMVGSTNRIIQDPLQYKGRSKVVFVIANVWMYLAEIAIITMKTLFPHYNPSIFRLDDIVVVLFFFALSGAMAQCSYRLYHLFKEIPGLGHMIQTRVVSLGIICALSFLLRGFLFVVSSKIPSPFLRAIMDPWLVYVVPECIPGVCVLYLMQVKIGSKGTIHEPLLTPARFKDWSHESQDVSPNYLYI